MPDTAKSEKFYYFGVITATTLVLYLSSLQSYILFHSLIEIFTIAIAWTLFILTLNTSKYLSNDYLKLLGIGYAFIAVIDLLHTLAYKGMNIFPAYGANLSAQLWIAARYLQAFTIFAAPLFATRKMSNRGIFGGYATVVSLLVALVYSGNFPDCFIEGKGLTTFKIVSEYLISAILLASLYFFYLKKKNFNHKVFFLITSSIVCTALSEISFTAYVSVYGFANMAGHFAKLASFYLIYRAILVTGLKEPFELIFRDLRQTQDKLLKAQEILEETVRERTAELGASEQRFRRLAENARDVIYRMSLPDGSYDYISPAATELFGYAPEEFYGSPQLIRKLIHPEWQGYFEEQWTILLLGDMPPTYEHPIVHKSGEIRWMNQRNILVRDGGGRIVAIEGIVTDITERKLAEEEMRRLSTRMEMILNAAGEGIYGIDANGDIIFVNPAAQEMLGYSGEELIGKNSHQVFHHTKSDGKPFPVEECLLHKAMKDGMTYRGENESFWSKGGKSFSVEHVNTPILEDGEVTGAVVVFKDISERKRMEVELRELTKGLETRVKERTLQLQESQQALMSIVEDLNEKSAELQEANTRLQEVDRLKSLFIASMSHELRTPLNSIIGFSSILHDEWAGPVNPEQKGNLAIILRSGKHLLNLINDVIDVSKIEAGKIESSPEEFDLCDLIDEAVNLVTKELEAKGLVLQVSALRQQMRTDRRRLLQCLLNLLSNAMKFTEQGEVTLETRIEPGFSAMADTAVAEISVTDTGIGIRKEELPKIFHPFVRLTPPLQPTVPGTGLGLYLSRKLAVEVLKGDILMTSEFGKGSRFTIRVPVRLT